MGSEAPPPACCVSSVQVSPLILGKPQCLDRNVLDPLHLVMVATTPVQVPAVNEPAASHLLNCFLQAEDRIAPGLPKELPAGDGCTCSLAGGDSGLRATGKLRAE